MDVAYGTIRVAGRVPEPVSAHLQTPIPGYEVPEGGPTFEANRRMGHALFTAGVDAWRSEARPVPDIGRETTTSERELATLIDPDMPDVLVPAMLGVWAHIHGLVTFEILHQLNWMYGDDVETSFTGELKRSMRSMGVTAEPTAPSSDE